MNKEDIELLVWAAEALEDSPYAEDQTKAPLLRELIKRCQHQHPAGE